MKVVHISTYDKEGGGAIIVCRNLHEAMLREGKDSTLLCRFSKDTNDKNSVVLKPSNSTVEAWNDLLFEYCSTYNRTVISNTAFSIPYESENILSLEAIKSANCIILHYQPRMISPSIMLELAKKGKSVIIILHDHRPFTGGCHTPTGCDLYREDCSICPHLSDDSGHITRKVWELQKVAYMHPNIRFVSPSYAMARRAKESSALKDETISVIPNGINEKTFCFIDKVKAKKKIGFDENKKYLLFGAYNHSLKIKGTEFLHQLIHELSSENVVFVFFGSEMPHYDCDFVFMNNLTNEEELADLYQACDVVFSLSEYETFGLMIAEAMACGTIPITFSVGALPELIDDGINGYLVSNYGDLKTFVEKFKKLLHLDRERLDEMSQKATDKIKNHFTLDVMVKNYSALMEMLTNTDANNFKSSACDSFKEFILDSSVKSIIDKKILEIKQTYKFIVVYGSGSGSIFGRYVLNQLKPDRLIDDEKASQPLDIFGLKPSKLADCSDLIGRHDVLFVITALSCEARDAMKEKLTAKGFDERNYFEIFDFANYS